MSTHTPGPWSVERGDVLDSDSERWSVLTTGPRRYFIATVENGAPGDTLETELANARLIAAAPDLLEAAAEAKAAIAKQRVPQNDAEAALQVLFILGPVLEQLRAAIAKATGAV
jgi:hypothetical protein